MTVFYFCELRARAMAQSSAETHGVTQRDNLLRINFFFVQTVIAVARRATKKTLSSTEKHIMSEKNLLILNQLTLSVTP